MTATALALTEAKFIPRIGPKNRGLRDPHCFPGDLLTVTLLPGHRGIRGDARCPGDQSGVLEGSSSRSEPGNR